MSLACIRADWITCVYLYTSLYVRTSGTIELFKRIKYVYRLNSQNKRNLRDAVLSYLAEDINLIYLTRRVVVSIYIPRRVFNIAVDLSAQ